MEQEYLKQRLEEEQEMANIQHYELSRKAKSRMRHHNDVKSKRKTQFSAKVLSSKSKKLSWNATPEEEFRTIMKAITAEKKASRIK